MNKTHQMKGKGHHHTKAQMGGPNKNEHKKKEDDSFIYNLGILIGCVAEIETTCGEKYEGVLSAFSHQALKIMIEAAHEPTEDDESSITKHYDLLIVPPEKISVIRFRNAEVSYATRDFQTDTVISAGRHINVGDKELTPWEGSDEELGDGLQLGSGSDNQNGWNTEDMFRKNEEKYGVKTTYKEDLSGYTTQIDKGEDSYKKQEEKAAQVAKEIEGRSESWERTQLENGGDDEEEAFSAVVRPGRNNNNNASNTVPQTSTAGGTDKYVPPSRRQQQQQQQQQQQHHHHHQQQQHQPAHQQHQPPHQQHQPPHQQHPPPHQQHPSPHQQQHPQHPHSHQQQHSHQPHQMHQQHPGNQHQHGNMSQMSHPVNANGPQQISNNNQNRKSSYGGPGGNNSQNPRGSYGQELGSYHGRRGNYDGPRGPPRTYGGHHGDRRDDGRQQDNRQPRMNKGPGDRDRRGGGRDGDKIGGLKNFGESFRLQGQGGAQSRAGPHHGPVHASPPVNAQNSPSSGQQMGGPGVRNPSPPSNASQISMNQTPNKPKKDEYSPVPPLIQASGPPSVTSKGSSGTDSPRSTTTNTASANSSSPSPSGSAAAVNVSVTEGTGATPAVSATVSPAPVAVPGGAGDSKINKDDAKKSTFRFNLDAKEFVPSKAFQPTRSPSTPPRPPSTPATPQQVLQGPMPPMMQYVQQQQQQQSQLVYHAYTHAQQAMPPSSGSTGSSGGNTPRQRHSKNVMNVQQQRQDMTPPMQMAGHPISLQARNFYVPQTGGYPQVVQLPQGMVLSQQVYQTDASGGAHPQTMHYIHPNGTTTQVTAGHQSTNQPHSNQLTQQPNLQANGHVAYGQAAGNHGHQSLGYPIAMSVPMVPYAMPVTAFVPHQGGANAGIPHSQ